MLNTDGRCNLAVTARVRAAWKSSVGTDTYTNYVRRSCLTYGSETWPMKMHCEVKLDGTEADMDVWFYIERKKGTQRSENCWEWNQSKWL